MAARDYVRLVLLGVDSVADISVVADPTAAGCAGGPAVRRAVLEATGLALIGDRLQELLIGAERGSDAQLAYVQALARRRGLRSSPRVAGSLLDGTAMFEGLSVDTELRWTLLYRLVSRGLAGFAEIESELARDATERRRAACCVLPRGRPDPRTTRAMWERDRQREAANATFRAILSGFADPDQRDLTERFRDSYFACWPTSGGSGASDMAQRFVAIGYTIARFPQRPSRSPTTTSRQTQRPRRCADCWSRAATTWPARCVAAPAMP